MQDFNEDLIGATRNGDEAGLKSLLSRPGCDPLSRDRGGVIALMWAAYKGYTSCVELLIPVSEVLAKSNVGRTALMYAAMSGHTDCAKLLILVSDALAKDNNGMNALMWAAMGGSASCAQLLIPVSDVFAKNNKGRVASELARNEGHAPLAGFIDAYALALGEMSMLGSLSTVKVPRKKAPLRV